MQNHDMSTGVGIQIAGTFDIAVTRQHIRRLSEELQWPASLRLRAIAALTALVETLYFKDRQRAEPLVVYISVLERDEIFGIEFYTDTDFEIVNRQFPVARWQLERVSDELEIENHGDYDHIVMRVWPNGRGS
jgi:hypothetical protein